MSRLEVQKRLLIAESELNRARLAAELASLGDGVATITAGIVRIEAVCASIVDVTHGLLDLGKAAPSGAGRSSLLSTVIAGGSLLATLWQTFRGRRRD